MNNFTRFFLNEDWKMSPSAARVHVGAFGKHPGWNDHLDDIGLVTASLVEARSILYGGIARQIEHATWEKAGPDKVMPGFDHVFHWRRLNESHTGLIWSSQDGKGRALYPMILIAHCVTRSFSWLANELLPALEELKTKCRGTTSSGVVISYIKAAEQALQARFPTGPHVSAGPGHGVAAWTAHFTREPESFRRVVHHLRRNFSVFAPGTFAWCQDAKPTGMRCLRLPQIPGAHPAESLNAWISFLATQLEPAVPFFGLAPAGREWMDVIVGEPDPSDFFLLRALPTALPVVTQIPYQLEAENQTNDASLLASLAAGRLPEVSCMNGQAVEASREAASKWLVRFRPGSRPGFFSRLFG